jgi:hypothetical protein
MAALESRL